MEHPSDDTDMNETPNNDSANPETLTQDDDVAVDTVQTSLAQSPLLTSPQPLENPTEPETLAQNSQLLPNAQDDVGCASSQAQNVQRYSSLRPWQYMTSSQALANPTTSPQDTQLHPNAQYNVRCSQAQNVQRYSTLRPRPWQYMTSSQPLAKPTENETSAGDTHVHPNAQQHDVGCSSSQAQNVQRSSGPWQYVTNSQVQNVQPSSGSSPCQYITSSQAQNVPPSSGPSSMMSSQVQNVQPSQVNNVQPSQVQNVKPYVQPSQVQNLQPSQVQNVQPYIQPSQVQNVQPSQVQNVQPSSHPNSWQYMTSSQVHNVQPSSGPSSWQCMTSSQVQNVQPSSGLSSWQYMASSQAQNVRPSMGPRPGTSSQPQNIQPSSGPGPSQYMTSSQPQNVQPSSGPNPWQYMTSSQPPNVQPSSGPSPWQYITSSQPQNVQPSSGPSPWKYTTSSQPQNVQLYSGPSPFQYMTSSQVQNAQPSSGPSPWQYMTSSQPQNVQPSSGPSPWQYMTSSQAQNVQPSLGPSPWQYMTSSQAHNVQPYSSPSPWQYMPSFQGQNVQPSSGLTPWQHLPRMHSSPSPMPFWNGYQYINPMFFSHFPTGPAFGYPGIPAASVACDTSTVGLNKRVFSSQVLATITEGPELPNNLREWMKSKGPSATKPERLHMFMQVVRLVNGAHRNGMGLLDLRPLCFALLENNQKLKYVGRVLSDESFSRASADARKRCLERSIRIDGDEDDEDHFGRKVQKVGKGKSVITDAEGSKRSSHEKRLLTCDVAELEKGWYDFPAGHVNRDLPFCNVYCLGLLLFEILCQFESIGEHHEAMVDVRQRILPPEFVSRHPEEARFLIRLLHQEPFSRPSTREIMRFVSRQKQPEAEEDDYADSEEEEECNEQIADSDVLLHFLSSSEEAKRAKAESLSETIRLLDSDIDRTLASRNRTNIPESSTTGSTAFRDRLLSNIGDLETAYFTHRSHTQLLAEKPQFSRPDKGILTERPSWHSRGLPQTGAENGAGSSFDGISQLARHSRFQVCGGLRYYGMVESAYLINSMSVDRDEEFLATAGDTKIKIFEVDRLLGDDVDVHCPLLEFPNESRVSSVCWNTYIKNYLVSADYGGVVQVWDAGTGQRVSQYKEHTHRACSVDFSKVDPTKFASGSEDCSVRLWSTNENASVGLIRNRAKVCCVQFSPYSSHLLSCGSSDSKIYCYDIRHTLSPWCTIEGHAAAVSYVMFLDSENIVSASTDSTLKLWDLNQTTLNGPSTNACTLTYRGHTDKKNFVGLTVWDGYIACGSETNEVYAYHRSMPMPIIVHKFEQVEDDIECFVSSVCWRKKSEMLIAANSNGNLYMLRMV